MMNKRIKAKWLKALRSGKYKQGRMALKDGNMFCCLGVLCDLHSKSNDPDAADWEDSQISSSCKRYLGEENFLPEQVVLWAGLGSHDPMAGEVVLSERNDSKGFGFKRIAKLIEAHL